MPYQVSMMGWVGSGEDFCGLGWVGLGPEILGWFGFWKVTHDQLWYYFWLKSLILLSVQSLYRNSNTIADKSHMRTNVPVPNEEHRRRNFDLDASVSSQWQKTLRNWKSETHVWSEKKLINSVFWQNFALLLIDCIRLSSNKRFTYLLTNLLT